MGDRSTDGSALQELIATAVEQQLAFLRMELSSQLNRAQYATRSTGTKEIRDVSSVFPWSDKLTFGLSKTARNKIKVLNCKARRYGDPQGTAPNQTIYYTCSDKEITFTGDGTGQRICWKWNPTDGLQILDNAQTNDPMDDSNDIYGVVAVFDVVNGRADLAVGGVIQCGSVLVLPTFTVAGV